MEKVLVCVMEYLACMISYPKLMFHEKSHGDVVREPELVSRLWCIWYFGLGRTITNAKNPLFKSIKENQPGQSLHPQQGMPCAKENQCNVTQCNSIQCNEMQCNAMQCKFKDSNAMQAPSFSVVTLIFFFYLKSQFWDARAT